MLTDAESRSLRPGAKVAIPRAAIERFRTSQVLTLVREGTWIAGGNAVAAVATLAGVRLITEHVAQSLYGAFVLLNGVLALLQGITYFPVAQAALRFYPDYSAAGAPHALRRYLFTVFARRWCWTVVALAVVGTVDAMTSRRVSSAAWVLLAVMFALEAWKTIEIVMHNAARRQAAYAALLASDGIARAVGPVVGVWTLGPSLESLFLGQCAGLSLVLVFLAVFSHGCALAGVKADLSGAKAVHLEGRVKRFAAPLALLPFAGWLSGVGDRYIVGGMLGLAQAGIYAAAYGLVSRPMLMVGGIVDATMRQVLYAAVADNDLERERKAVFLWLGVSGAAGVALALSVAYGNRRLVHWLLAAEYRDVAVQLLPWIAIGYVPVLANQALERLLYARGRTRTVVLLQCAGGIAAVVGAVIGARCLGLSGVAIAVPFCFSVQLLLTVAAVARRPKVCR